MKTMISFQCDTLDEARAVIDAVAAIGKTPHACSKQYVNPEELAQQALNEQARQRVDALPVNTKGVLGLMPVEQRKNINPGDPTITKIGANTEGALFGVLRAGGQPEAKYAEHMKLLWKRGKVKFDGSDFYL